VFGVALEEQWRGKEVEREVAAVIYAYFEAGKNKDLVSLAKFHSPADVFTKFDDVPPFTRQGSGEAFVLEQASFANISDYEYKIMELRIDLIGGAALATFYLDYTGMFVNDYSFEGRTVGSRSRVSMLLARFDGSWRMVHEHLSSVPDWPSEKRRDHAR
jgi:ketosteroid isomerase-like protein